MTIFKRLYTTLTASVDQLVGEIENHDALIEATLKEQHRKLAAARVQLKRMQAREQQAADEIRLLQEKMAQWQQRALGLDDDDEERALVCLQHRQRAGEQLQRLQAHRQRYQQAVQSMSRDIRRCEQEVADLRQKHALFRARQHSSEALAVVNAMDVDIGGDLEGRFDRWEARITEREMFAETASDSDDFEQAFVEQEQREQLREELAALRRQRDGGDGQQGGSEHE